MAPAASVYQYLNHEVLAIFWADRVVVGFFHLGDEAGSCLAPRHAAVLAASGPGGGIVLTNAVGQDWLSYPAMARLRPDLIHLQIQGHHDGRAAVDYTVNAEMGFPLVTAPRNRRPASCPGWRLVKSAPPSPCPNPASDPTWPRSVPPPGPTVTTTCSAGRKCG